MGDAPQAAKHIVLTLYYLLMGCDMVRLVEHAERMYRHHMSPFLSSKLHALQASRLHWHCALVQIPGVHQKGVEALKALLQHYTRPAAASIAAPTLPFPALTPGQPMSPQQLVDLLTCGGAVVMHAYAVLYAHKVVGSQRSKDEGALRQLDAGGATLFLEAVRLVVTAAVAAGAQHGSSQPGVLAVSAAVQQAASKLPTKLLSQLHTSTEGGPCFIACRTRREL